MLHFFPLFSWSLEGSPFGAELRRLNVPHRFFATQISLRYKSKLALLLSIYPRLAWFALRAAIRSLALSRPRPDAVIIGTDIEALVFGMVRRLLGRPTLVVFLTFIVTPRRGSRFKNAAYILYYRAVLWAIDVAVCHSRAEIAAYVQAFPRARRKFVCVPFGTTVTGREALIAAQALKDDRDAWIVTAGRSGRDYPTLAKAIRGLPCRLRIICDVTPPVAGIEPSEQIEVVRDCFDDAYIQALSDALFVVVPLALDDISAGQMVLLQASALGKATIITRTATTPEYATDGENALLVSMGHVEQMRSAIRRLLEDRPLRKQLGTNAVLRFERDYSTEAYVRNLVAAIQAARRPS